MNLRQLQQPWHGKKQDLKKGNKGKNPVKTTKKGNKQGTHPFVELELRTRSEIETEQVPQRSTKKADVEERETERKKQGQGK